MKSSVWGGTDCPVTQPYGCTTVAVEPVDPACPGGHFHCGIDVAMVVGTPLYAARAGVVLFVGYGLLEINTGVESDWYVHIDRVAPGITAFSGVAVAEGQLVAYSGNKAPSGGFTTGPHLHFEVQTGNLNVVRTSVDPSPTLEASMSRSDMVAVLRAYLRVADPASYTDAVLNQFGDIAVTQGLDAAMVQLIAAHPPVTHTHSASTSVGKNQ